MNEWLRLFLGETPRPPTRGQVLTDREALMAALAAGFRGYGRTAPNPPVGCVILDRENRFLASGFHARAGEPHAEIEALRQWAGVESIPRGRDGWDLSALPIADLEGARVFVTLEPCAHEGRTPSCAKTLAKLPIHEVQACLRDPNPKTSGRGFELLKAAGKKVRVLEGETGEQQLVEAARALCEVFLINQEQNRLFVSLKVATSLDGIMALKSGESQWITSDESRLFARFLRGAHEACLVGKNTILQDNPVLDARETELQEKHRRIVILDPLGETLAKPELQVFTSHAPENVLVCVSDQAQTFQSSFAQVLRVDAPDERQFLVRSLNKLWEREVQSVWIEGGAQTLSHALAAGLGDRLWLFQGPHLLGAQHGRSWTEAWGVEQMRQRKTLAGVRHLSLGSDHLTTGRFQVAKG